MRTTLVTAGLLALAGCSNAPPAMMIGTDAGPLPMVDAPVDPCAAPIPPATAPYGTSAGRSFRPFTLENCDGSGPYSFYGDNQWCEPTHRLTLISIAAVWCVPCQMESALLTDAITEPYRDRGVRVIQILVDGRTRGGGAVMADCTGWVSTYGLTNVELLDSGGAETGRYFPSGSLPSTIIVDDEGIIRFYEDGVRVGLTTLTATLDALLAEP
jgi:hypothetical protein